MICVSCLRREFDLGNAARRSAALTSSWEWLAAGENGAVGAAVLSGTSLLLPAVATAVAIVHVLALLAEAWTGH